MMRFFTYDLQRNLIKILCLTIGLAVGLILVAKIYFEVTADSFFPNADRLCIVTESVTQNGEYREYNQTPGGIAPGLKRYVPQVEAATRYTSFASDTGIKLEDGRIFDGQYISLADSNFFDVLETPILAGNPHETLDVLDYCMIPRSLAEKIGDNVIGMSLGSTEVDYKMTVGGVYEDFPANSSIRNAIYVSLPSLARFAHYTPENMMGNDRYISFVRLACGTSPEDVQPMVTRMLEDYIDSDELTSFKFNILMRPLTDLHTSSDNVSTMLWMFSLLAIVMLMAAGLNYLLICIGQMNSRRKEMAVRKCYGTSNICIFGRILAETLFFLFVSMLLAILLVFCFANLCRNLLGYSPEQLLTIGNVWIAEGAVCIALLFVTGAVPAWMYCRTPVAHAFRSGIMSRMGWKKILLALQFFASGMLLCLLSLVVRQYNFVADQDLGIDTENLGYAYMGNIPRESRSALVAQIRDITGVESVSTTYQNIIEHASGNNIWIGEDWTNTVNVADMYFATPGFTHTLGMRLIQGEDFSAQTDSTKQEVIVDSEFINVLHRNFGFEGDNIIGQRFHITEHINWDRSDEYTIVGVVDRLRRGGIDNESADRRAAVFFPTGEMSNNLYVRFSILTPEVLQRVQGVIDRLVPGKDIYITPYRIQIDARIKPIRNFGTAVTLVSIAILMIALIGLAGYTTDEVQHRAREIAIRKVTGTSALEIVSLFCRSMLKIALPSLIAGGAMAVVAGKHWISQFTDQTTMGYGWMTITLICALILLTVVVTINTITIARTNPVTHLRHE